MSVPGTRLGGVLGDALDANLHGRLSHFIVDEHSPAIVLFAPSQRELNREGDWYGEHAGKWLVAAARAAARSRDAALRARVLRVAQFLVSTQEADGYLGTYAVDRRFMQPQPPKPVTWDGAPSVRTWDIWTHAYLVLGLLEVHQQFDAPVCLEAARRIGVLCLNTLEGGGIDITDLGNHHGMSATVLLDPAVALYFATHDDAFLKLARVVLRQANEHRELALLPKALAGTDAAFIATGKAYQLAWNLVGIAKLYRATGDTELLTAVEMLWQSIRDHHLTLGGGPWGGVAHRSRECFNPPGVFSPQGYVETCSTLAWIQLNRELLQITHDAKYAEEIEKSAYNDLLAAQASDGEDWCYYVFPNGRRVHTTYWRCCKSSGAMALEELPGIAFTQVDDRTLAVNVHGPGEAGFEIAGGVRLESITMYPYSGDVRIRVSLHGAARFTVRVRVPSWVIDPTMHINGDPVEVAVVAGTYANLEREWHDGDEILARFPAQPVVHRRINRNVQESLAPDGSPVRQEVLRDAFVAVTQGALVYATALIDGFKSSESVRLPAGEGGTWLRHDADPPRVTMDLGYREPLAFTPYFAAGGRADGAWRLTWLPLAPPTQDS
ncbi:beta-L-arabinofuranosidase domain-containing protein [Pinirhizobacter sp.]|uniref:beta-L-arabinofuranosidase domain-containing protein n=1 Tax=Pinirhizobacter sp. TaxID=2950432 RepID=UPI002F420C99